MLIKEEIDFYLFSFSYTFFVMCNVYVCINRINIPQRVSSIQTSKLLWIFEFLSDSNARSAIIIIATLNSIVPQRFKYVLCIHIEVCRSDDHSVVETSSILVPQWTRLLIPPAITMHWKTHISNRFFSEICCLRSGIKSCWLVLYMYADFLCVYGTDL